MSTTDVSYELVNNAITLAEEPQWDKSTFDRYHVHVAVVKEEDGAFSAIVLNLPGAGSCGPTEKEAIENAKEAVLGVIESHRAAGEEVPWIDCYQEDVPDGATLKWVLVDA